MINDETTTDLEQFDNEDQAEDTEETTTNEESEESTEDTKDWKKEALKYKAILDRNKGKTSTKKATTKEETTEGFGLAEKSYLLNNEIKKSEFEFVQEKLAETGLKDIDALLDSRYFQSELESFRESETTKNATIKGKRGNGVATDSVEYWMTKPIEEVPKDMRTAVVNKKLENSNSKGVFYNS